MLITDQKKLTKLALSLRVDIEFLLDAIKLDPVNLNEAARSQFLEGIFHFLRQATDLTDEKVRNHLIFSSTSLAAEQVRPASAPPRPPSSHYRDDGHPRRNRSPRPESSMSLYGQRRYRERRPRVTEPHSLWFPNAPSTASPALVAQQIFGGPLESIRWYEHYDDHGLSYLINFLNHKDAASFLNFSRTPGYRMTFPGVDDDWRPYLTWSTNPGIIRAHIRRAAYNMDNPARRALVFENFPAESVSRFEMKRRLKALERQFFVEHWVDTYKIYPNTAVAYIVFSKIESAMRVMEWHGVGLLGPEFNDCVVTYGRDPSDQPFPVIGEDVITDLPPPLSSLVFQSPVILATTPPRIPSPPTLPATLLTTIPRVPPVDFPTLIDIPAWVESHSPVPSITGLETPASSVASSENLLGDSPPAVYLNPARAMEMANFSDLFFAQEWDGK